MEPSLKRPKGRPVKLTMPSPIPDSPENVARALMSTPYTPYAEWEFVKEQKKEME